MKQSGNRDLFGKQRQHYVPRVLLREFASAKGKQTIVFDLDKDTRFRTSILNVAHEKGFSDFADETGRSRSIEEWLSRIESDVGSAIQRVLKTRDAPPMTSPDRIALANFVAVLSVRTKRIREEEIAFPRMVLDEIDQRGEVLSENIRAEFEGATANDAAMIHASTIVKISSLGPNLAARPWRLFAPPKGREFCTSDNPVLRFNAFNPEGDLGLLCRGVVLQLALCPTLLLCILDPVFAPDGSKVEILCPEDLLHYNSLLVSNAHRFLMSLSGNFDVRPDMRNGGRQIRVS